MKLRLYKSGGVLVLFLALTGCSAFLKWSFVRKSDLKIDVGGCQVINTGNVAAFLGHHEVSCTVTVRNRGTESVHISRIEFGPDSYSVGRPLGAGETISQEVKTIIDTNVRAAQRRLVRVHDEKGVLNYEEVALRP